MFVNDWVFTLSVRDTVDHILLICSCPLWRKDSDSKHPNPDAPCIWSNSLATSHDLGPQKVAFRKGNPLISGKSKLVKYYNLTRCMEYIYILYILYIYNIYIYMFTICIYIYVFAIVESKSWPSLSGNGLVNIPRCQWSFDCSLWQSLGHETPCLAKVLLLIYIYKEHQIYTPKKVNKKRYPKYYSTNSVFWSYLFPKHFCFVGGVSLLLHEV